MFIHSHQNLIGIKSDFNWNYYKCQNMGKNISW